MFQTLLSCAVVVGATLVANPGFAQDGLPLVVVAPDGIEHTLHLDDLDAMEQVSFATTTQWTENEAVFSGVAVREILEEFGIEGTVLRMSALNDYAVEMPLDELGDEVPIVATRIDGKVVPVREKGPYWVMFPFDRGPEFRTEVTYARSVWQLKSLSVPE